MLSIWIIFSTIILSVCSTDDLISKGVPIQSSTKNKGASFGQSFSIDNNQAIIASPQETVGSEWDDGNAGSIFFFEKNSKTKKWEETQMYFTEDRIIWDKNGFQSDLLDDYAIVSTVDKAVDGKLAAGTVYVLRKQPSGLWKETQILRSPEISEHQQFGRSICQTKDYAFIGVPKDSNELGAVYIYKKGNNGLEYYEKITSGLSSSNFFGYGLDCNDEILVIADYKSSEIKTEGGMVFVFANKDGNGFKKIHQIAPSKLSYFNGFGSCVAMDNDYLVVGALPHKEAYIFHYNRTSEQWVEKQNLKLEDQSQNSFYGVSVAIQDDIILVGASALDSLRGNAFLYHRINGTYLLMQDLFPEGSDIEANDIFGRVSGISGSSIFVSADQFNNSQGIVYAYEIKNYGDENLDEGGDSILAFVGIIGGIVVGAIIGCGIGCCFGFMYYLNNIHSKNQNNDVELNQF